MKIELTVLGLLLDENLYGYEIKKRIVENFGEYADIKFGSIYYAIKKAVDNEHVKRIGTEKEGGNPERFIYQILPAGRKYYKKALKEYFDQTMIHFDIDILLMFLHTLEEDQKKEFFYDRKNLLKNKLCEIKEKIDIDGEDEKEERKNHIYTYLESHLKAELSWIRSVE